jgi:hypothetical protein
MALHIHVHQVQKRGTDHYPGDDLKDRFGQPEAGRQPSRKGEAKAMAATISRPVRGKSVIAA